MKVGKIVFNEKCDCGNKYPDHNITIQEHKAPTDESITIFKGMLEEAQKNVIKVFKPENNILKLVGVYFDHNSFNRCGMGGKLGIVFILNDKEWVIKEDIEPDVMTMIKIDPIEAAKLIYKKVYDVFFQHLFEEVVKDENFLKMFRTY